jgi:hypothetical protein
VRQSPTSENVSTEAEDIAEIHYQATTGKDTANWEDLVCPVVTLSLQICEMVIVTSSYRL